MRLVKVIAILTFAGALGVAPVMAASRGGTAPTVGPTVSKSTKVHVLRDQDQKLSAIVTINRQHGADVALGVEIQTHRDQIEDTGGEGGFQDRFSVIADPVVGRQDVYYAHEPGTPCSTCRPIDSVCALIGDRC